MLGRVMCLRGFNESGRAPAEFGRQVLMSPTRRQIMGVAGGHA